MHDLYSIELYTAPMEEAIVAHNIRLVSKITKIVGGFPEYETTVFFNRALCQAAENGFLKGVRVLSALTDPKADDSCALRWAAMNGHFDCVKALIPLSDPYDQNSHALILAAEGGHATCVKALIKVSNPAALNSAALKIASECGHLDCVKLLLPVSDATHNRSEALCRALNNGWWDVMNELCTHSDLESVRQALIEWDGADDKVQWLDDKIAEQRKLLHDTIAKKIQNRGVVGRISKI